MKNNNYDSFNQHPLPPPIVLHRSIARVVFQYFLSSFNISLKVSFMKLANHYSEQKVILFQTKCLTIPKSYYLE